MSVVRLTILFFILSFTLTPIAAQESVTATIEMVAFFDGSFKAGQWLPVRVTVANTGPDRSAVIRVGTTNSGTYDTAVELPRGARKSVVMYVRPESFARTLRARLFDGTQELARTDMDLHVWTSGSQVIGLLAERPVTAPLPVSRSQQIKLHTQPLTSADLPPRAEGLSSFDALIVDGIPTDTLQPEQLQALDDWVRSGGQLIVSAATGSALLDMLPEPLQIGTPGETQEQAVSDTVLRELGADARLRAVTLTPRDGTTAIDALTVQRAWGRGRITLVGFSLSDPALQQLPPNTQLWSSLLNLRQLDPNLPPDMTLDYMQTQQIAQALYNLPSLTLPPLGVLASLLIAYILLVGPVLYVVLRYLDRQILAWVIIPVLTVIFSLGAYGYGLSIRGNDIILNQISLVQPLGDRARVRTFAGIFSPTDRTYNATVEGDALVYPVQFDSKMWGGPNQAAPLGQFLQNPGAVRDLQVGQWSMSSFAAEARLPMTPLVADLELGDGVLRGTVRNTGTATMRDVAIIQGARALLVGDLAGGAEKQVEFRVDGRSTSNTPLSMVIFKDRWNPNSGPPPELRIPTQIIDSIYSYTPASRPSAPVVLGWLDSNPITINLDVERVEHQHLTLVETPAELSFAPTLTLPHGWTWPVLETGVAGGGTCTTQWGPGIVANSDIITATLQLPQEMIDRTITKATIYTQIEGPTPERMLSEVYDWQAGEWRGQTETFTSFELSDPARFFQHGMLRARLHVPGGALRGSCIHIDSSIGGTR